MTIEDNDFLTIDELAKMLRCSRGTIYNCIKAGKGPKILKIGQNTLFEKTDIRAWIDAQKTSKISTVDSAKARAAVSKRTYEA